MKIERVEATARVAHVGLDTEVGAGVDEKNNFVKVGRRVLQGCSATPGWHPQYLGGWTRGFCAFETNCQSSGYASELAC
ncbi:hypothetical protein THAOC_26815, partial [Thalassiosira oceanica]